jgi:hypothetical protein
VSANRPKPRLDARRKPTRKRCIAGGGSGPRRSDEEQPTRDRDNRFPINASSRRRRRSRRAIVPPRRRRG